MNLEIDVLLIKSQEMTKIALLRIHVQHSKLKITWLTTVSGWDYLRRPPEVLYHYSIYTKQLLKHQETAYIDCWRYKVNGLCK